MPRNRTSVTPVVTNTPVVVPKPAQTGLGQVVKEGMAFGVGNAIAHTIIGRLFGSPSVVKDQQKAPGRIQYEKCMELTNNNHELCEQF